MGNDYTVPPHRYADAERLLTPHGERLQVAKALADTFGIGS